MATQPRTRVALEPLYIGRARAHNRGDLVPEENVEPNGWSGQVASAASKAGRDALGLPDDATPAEAAAAARSATSAQP